MKAFILTTLAALAVGDNGPAAQIPISNDEARASPAALDAIPLIGFGTWNLDRSNASDAVSWAIQKGYRHIDAAAIYGNEVEVGRGIREGLFKAGLSREDIWVTSKLWNNRHDVNRVEDAIDETLHHLGLEYLDLYHMHWPVADTFFGGHKIEYRDTWAAMTLLLANGKTRHIGVANFSPDQLEDLLNHTAIPPAVHQMELHPYLQQNDFLKMHKKLGIHVTAYSPLAGTNPTYGDDDDKSRPPALLTKNKDIAKVAKKRGCTPAQVVLQWGMSRGTSVIPKSQHADRITENLHSPECMLKKKDLERIDELYKYHQRYNNPSKGWGVNLYDDLEDSQGKHKSHS